MFPSHFGIQLKQPHEGSLHHINKKITLNKQNTLHWINKNHWIQLMQKIALDKNQKDCIKSTKKIALNKEMRLHWIKKIRLNQKL